MRGLVIPHSSPAVRWYRFQNPAKRLGFSEFDKYAVEGDWYEALAEWMTEHGLDWDVAWTADYNNEMQAVLSALSERGTKIVADVDDWFDEVPKGNMAHRHWFGQKRDLYHELLQSADRVVVSTQFLHEKYGGVIAPNYIEPDQWDWAERPTKDPAEVVVLCSGGTGRAGDYMAEAAGLRACLEIPHVKMVFMGAFPEWALDFPAGKAIWCRWVDLKNYPRMLKWIAPDIVVSPLEHNDFNRAKSNLKWLESAAIGACFVGENWGEYERTVANEETGVLCSGDWAERLAWICHDHVARRKIAEQGQAEMLRNWTWDAVGPAWRSAILGDAHGDYRNRPPDASEHGVRAAAG